MEIGDQLLESEDERLTKLDNRIERARAGHELARPVFGTIFLVNFFCSRLYVTRFGKPAFRQFFTFLCPQVL